MQVRTGDTEQSLRAKQSRQRPHLILTTPETLSTMLSQAAWRETGFETETVIVDEIHSFAEGKRGRCSRWPGAAGASARHGAATHRCVRDRMAGRGDPAAPLWPPRLCPGAGGCPQITRARNCRARNRNCALPPAGHNPFRIASTVAKIVEQNRCSLIFLTTRSGVERSDSR